MRFSIPSLSSKAKAAGLIVLVSFLLMLLYIDQPFFTTDEGDVFLVGSAIAKGQLLYGDVASQHMPVMYYFAAFFALFGVSTVTSFRLCFYGLMACIWGLMYYFYCDKINRKVLAIYPVIYIIMLRYIEMGHAVLSDQFQGLGMAILFFELLAFERTRELKLSNMIMISFAVFISFGSAFTAIIGVFYVAITVVVMELCRYRKDGLSIIRSSIKLVKSYWKLVAIVAAPFAVLMLIYLVTGTLDDFFSWAYLINRKVYPKYVGYGGSIFESFYIGIPNILATLKGELSLTRLVYITAVSGAVYFFVYIQKERRNFVLTFGLLLVLIGSATRGMFNFHGTPAMAVLCIMDAFALIGIIEEFNKSVFKQTIVALVLIVLSFAYIEMLPAYFELSIWNKVEKDPNHPAYVLDLITEEKEVVGFSTLDTNYLFESGTVPTKISAACPWIWEWGGEDLMEQCYNDPPRVFLYDFTYSIWGYPIVEHAAELHEFIMQNYTSLSIFNCSKVYVRNDYYDEAVKIVKTDRLINPGKPIPEATASIDSDTNTAKIVITNAETYQSVMLATWTMHNGQDDLVWYTAERQEDGTLSYTIDFSKHEVQGGYIVHVYVVDENKTSFSSELSFYVE